MYKKIIQMLIEAESAEDIGKVCAQISRAFQDGKITAKDNEQLFDLVSKIDGSRRAGVKNYKGQGGKRA